METTVYDILGKKVETLDLPEAVFGLKWNADLVHQVVDVERANRREKVAHVKMRGEVRGGGKKPWRQKGTGRARHGSTRSPIWRKGGVSHGPNTEVVYAKKINKKTAKKALATVLSAKLRDHEIVFMDSVSFPDHKTKNAAALAKVFSKKKEYALFGARGGKALILVPQYDTNVLRAARNLKAMDVKQVTMAQVRDLLAYKFLVIPKGSIAVLEKYITRKRTI